MCTRVVTRRLARRRVLSRKLSSRVLPQRATSASLVDEAVHVRFEDGREGAVSTVVAQDACRCAWCWNTSTNQRHAASWSHAKAIRASVSECGEVVHVHFKGGHRSITPAHLWMPPHHADDIRSHAAGLIAHVKRVPWFGGSDGMFEPLEYEDVVHTAEGRRRFLEAIWRDGYSIVRGGAPGVATAQAIGRIIGPMRETSIYGRDFHVRIVEGSGNDSSFSGVAIGPHSDGTYFSEPPGLQLLHCIEADPRGGDSQLVDGMAIAQTLQCDHPAAFELLSTIPIRFEFRDEKDWLIAQHRVFSMGNDDGDGDDRFQRLIFNNHDRLPLHHLPDEIIPDMYQALELLCATISDPARSVFHKLQPGDVLVMHNHRLLHGRSGFPANSTRHLYGFYLDGDDLMSRLRMAA